MAFIFQVFAFFVFICIFLKDRHNQAIVSPRKRFWYSIFLFINTGFLLRLFVVKESHYWILGNIFGLPMALLNIFDVIKENGFFSIVIYSIGIPMFFILQFPSFLIFWIQFSKNKKIKIKTTFLYVLWCAISIWLYIECLDREQLADQLRSRMEEKRIREIKQKFKISTQEGNTEKVPSNSDNLSPTSSTVTRHCSEKQFQSEHCDLLPP